MNIGYKIKSYRKAMKMTQSELGEKLGVKKNAVSKWECGRVDDIPTSKIKAMAKIFDIPWQMLVDDYMNEDTPKSKGVKIPVLGKVAAGIPIEAIEDIIDYEEITEQMAKSGDFFGLQIKGHSMEPRIADGDVVIVRKQDYCESGKIAIVLVDHEEATCKRVLIHENGITLMPLNPNYEPQFFNNKEVENIPVTILGQVVELRGKL